MLYCRGVVGYEIFCFLECGVVGISGWLVGLLVWIYGMEQREMWKVSK